MSIKSDNWIRRMAREHAMIAPFEPGQVREANGQRIVSYGTSSYGYDVRCADEFKIFTNINSTIVDPKNFDEKSFVDFRGDVCIIPPNSFALARTIEYFRVPRNVLVLCLGKSTYARCFRGDTRVALVDGTSATLEEMARRADSGELFWGYSIGENGRVIVSLLDAPRYVGRDSLVEVELDNGEVVCATPDHDFMSRDGRMLPAAALRPGQSLMPLYRQLARGYEMVYQPLNGHLVPTHRLADEWNVRGDIYADAPGTHRHHIDRNRRNNCPTNIERMLASDHIRMHSAESYGVEFDRHAHGAAISDALIRLRVALDETGSIRGAARALGCDRSVFRRFAETIAQFRGHGCARNHKVLAVREVAGDHDVYCLTVPEAGNFALEAGVFVLNCGIIVNVTPLEPEWRGKVTIEISNT